VLSRLVRGVLALAAIAGAAVCAAIALAALDAACPDGGCSAAAMPATALVAAGVGAAALALGAILGVTWIVEGVDRVRRSASDEEDLLAARQARPQRPPAPEDEE